MLAVAVLDRLRRLSDHVDRQPDTGRCWPASGSRRRRPATTSSGSRPPAAAPACSSPCSSGWAWSCRPWPGWSSGWPGPPPARRMERGLAARLGPLAWPTGGLLVPDRGRRAVGAAGPAHPPASTGGREAGRPRPAGHGRAGRAASTSWPTSPRTAPTRSSPAPAARSSSRCGTQDHLGSPTCCAAQGLWGACRAPSRQQLVDPGVVDLGEGRFRLLTEPGPRRALLAPAAGLPGGRHHRPGHGRGRHQARPAARPPRADAALADVASRGGGGRRAPG